ncbi:MAG: SPOR domain-containing protein [Bacteroidetes bacterium]|nr:MAG: SPOR domain-containing protein [Bacteroidota bacterium]
MKAIRLTICILSLLLPTLTSAQNTTSVKMNADPAFHRTFSNYLNANKNRKIEGYRVQVYNGNRNESNQWRSRFISKFPDLESMVIFETPDYKLQVGNYKTIYDAEAALLIIREEFPGAFIVETSIQPPTLSRPIKEETTLEVEPQLEVQEEPESTGKIE